MYRHINEIQSIDGFFTSQKDAAIISNGSSLFRIGGGPILMKQIVGVCVTGNDATASTVQFILTPTVGAAVALSIASGSIANKVAGDMIVLPAQAFSNAPALTVTNVAAINVADNNVIVVPTGVISTTVGVGPTTGTWKWYIRWFPLANNVTVSV